MDAAQINVRAVREALPRDAAGSHRLDAENLRLTARVRELEDQLRREQSRSQGLERGLAALSESVATLRAR